MKLFFQKIFFETGNILVAGKKNLEIFVSTQLIPQQLMNFLLFPHRYGNAVLKYHLYYFIMSLEKSAVATGLEKVTFHSNVKGRQWQRIQTIIQVCSFHMLQGNAQNPSS